MEKCIWIIITIAVGLLGGLIFTKIKFPAGAIVGALIAVGVLNIFTGRAYVPSNFKIVTYSMAGLYIGMGIDIDTVRNMKRLLKPLVIMIALFLFLCLSIGIVLYYATDLDVVTSLFSVAPGGITDVTLTAMDMGGDAPVVAVIQTLRLLSVYCISMPLAKVLAQKMNSKTEAPETVAARKVLTKEEKRQGILLSLCVAAVAGVIGYFLASLFDFMVLILIVAIAAAAAVNIKTGKLYLPKACRTVIQMLSGSLIGLSMTYDSLVHLKAALVPALLACFGFVIVNVILALVLYKTCKMDIVTAMLSSSAGGATEAALVADEFGGDSCTISVLQIARAICTPIFYPIAVKFLYHFL